MPVRLKRATVSPPGCCPRRPAGAPTSSPSAAMPRRAMLPRRDPTPHCTQWAGMLCNCGSVLRSLSPRTISVFLLQGMQRRGSALPSFSTDVPVAPPPGPELPEMGVFAPQATSNGNHRLPLTDDLESPAPQSARCVPLRPVPSCQLLSLSQSCSQCSTSVKQEADLCRGSEADDAAQPAGGDLDGGPELAEWPEDEAASAAPTLVRQSTGALLSLPALDHRRLPPGANSR